MPNTSPSDLRARIEAIRELALRPETLLADLCDVLLSLLSLAAGEGKAAAEKAERQQLLDEIVMGELGKAYAAGSGEKVLGDPAPNNVGGDGGSTGKNPGASVRDQSSGYPPNSSSAPSSTVPSTAPQPAARVERWAAVRPDGHIAYQCDKDEAESWTSRFIGWRVVRLVELREGEVIRSADDEEKHAQAVDDCFDYIQKNALLSSALAALSRRGWVEGGKGQWPDALARAFGRATAPTLISMHERIQAAEELRIEITKALVAATNGWVEGGSEQTPTVPDEGEVGTPERDLRVIASRINADLGRARRGEVSPAYLTNWCVNRLVEIAAELSSPLVKRAAE